ncbi:MAG TPA: hypothetical protein VKX40_14785 [Aequorivita sp.]|nr:hypothetical protein [Aequorivita sp.]
MDNRIFEASFGKVSIIDNIIVININEGYIFRANDLKELFDIFDTFFPNQKFGYLTNRVNDYTIDLSPELYKAVHPNLTAIAAVCYNQASFKNAKFEKEFYKKGSFEAFTDFQEAVAWLKAHI